MLLALLGRRAEAIRVELNALKLNPGDSPLLRHLAILYFSVGDEAAGRVYSSLAYDASPDTGRGSFGMFQQFLEDQARQLVTEAK